MTSTEDRQDSVVEIVAEVITLSEDEDHKEEQEKPPSATPSSSETVVPEEGESKPQIRVPRRFRKPDPFSLINVVPTVHLHTIGFPIEQDTSGLRPGPDPNIPGRPKPLRFLYGRKEIDRDRIYRARYICLRSEAYALCPSKRYPGGYLIRACEGFTLPSGSTGTHLTFLDIWTETGLMGVVSGVPEYLNDQHRPQVWCDTITDRTPETGLQLNLRNVTQKDQVVKRGQNLALLQFTRIKRIQFRYEEQRELLEADTPDGLSDVEREEPQESRRPERDTGFHELGGDDLGENIMDVDEFELAEPRRDIEETEENQEIPLHSTKIHSPPKAPPSRGSPRKPGVSLPPKGRREGNQEKGAAREFSFATVAREAYKVRQERRRHKAQGIIPATSKEEVKTEEVGNHRTATPGKEVDPAPSSS